MSNVWRVTRLMRSVLPPSHSFLPHLHPLGGWEAGQQVTNQLTFHTMSTDNWTTPYALSGFPAYYQALQAMDIVSATTNICHLPL